MQVKHLVLTILVSGYSLNLSHSALAQTSKPVLLARHLCQVSSKYDPKLLADEIEIAVSMTNNQEMKEMVNSTLRICPQNSFVFEAANRVKQQEIQELERRVEILNIKNTLKRLLISN